MREVQSIELIMENCEVMQFKRGDVGTFTVSNIQRYVSRRAMNLIGEHNKAEELCLQLSAKANTQESFSSTWHDGAMTPFERLLKYNDVTAININYTDKSEEYIYVNWCGELYEENQYQTCAQNKHTGDLYLVISPTATVRTYFSELLKETETICWELYQETEEETE